MSRRADLALRLAIAVVAALAVAPVAGLFLPKEPFHRVITRCLQVFVVLALVIRRAPSAGWAATIRGIGLRGPFRLRRFAAGAAVGIAGLVLVLLVSWATGGRVARETPHRVPLYYQLTLALLGGLAVGFFEEMLVRGYLKDAIGGLASAVLFAAVHFFQPRGATDPASGGYDPLLAVKRLPELLEAWMDPQNATLGFLSLLVMGLALNRLRDRTGSLYMGIGLHAGIVFVIALYRRVLHGEPVGSAWIHGRPLMRDGLLTLVALLLVLLAAYRAPLPRWARADAGAPPPPA